MTLTPYTSSTPYSVGSTDYLAGINYERMRAERLRKTQSALKKLLKNNPLSRKLASQRLLASNHYFLARKV